MHILVTFCFALFGGQHNFFEQLGYVFWCVNLLLTVDLVFIHFTSGKNEPRHLIIHCKVWIHVTLDKLMDVLPACAVLR
jgi:hypothetical protein